MNQYIDIIKLHCTQKRFEHSLRVSQEAIKLANHYNLNTQLVEKAGLLHDIAKNHTPNSLNELGINCTEFDACWNMFPAVWHAFVGPLLIEYEFPGESKPIASIVKCHTTGNKNMSPDEKVIFVADYIEPGRNDDRSEATELAYKNINKAVAFITKQTIKKLESKNNPIHPFTLECWQWYSQFLED